MRIVTWMAVAFFLSGIAAADLCPNCAGRMFTMDVGKCKVCAAPTSSGAFQLCKACSKKLSQCGACRAAPDATKAEKPVVRADAKERLETRARRVNELKGMIARKGYFRLLVERYSDPLKGEPKLLLALGEVTEKEAEWCPNRAAVDAKQAVKIADYLADSGLLDTAASHLHQLIPVSNPPCYGLTLLGGVEGGFSAEIGRDATGLKHLEAIRTLLDGDAAIKMAALAAELKPALAITAERKKALAENVKSFKLTLYYVGQQDPKIPRRDLTLATFAKPVRTLRQSPRDVLIDEAQALKIIDWLEKDGFLAKAYAHARVDWAGPCYVLQVFAGEDLMQSLGWDASTVRRIESLAGVLDDVEAMKQLIDGLADVRPMDVFPDPLSGMRKEGSAKDDPAK